MIILPSKSWARVFHAIGVVFVATSLLFLLVTFFPVLKEEARYQLSPQHSDVRVVSRAESADLKDAGTMSTSERIIPIDEDFGIVIPKIGANARVIPDVDWQDARVYQQALALGVAQARGTALPGEFGTVFLFSHSGVDFLEAARYNALFYLIDKLVDEDEIVLMYRGEKFTYQVTEKKIVSSESIEYLTGDKEEKTLTLMTCWPAGTTWKRLVVTAKQVAP